MQEKKTVTGEFRCISAQDIQPSESREAAPKRRFPFKLRSKLARDAVICAALALGVWGLAAIDSDVTNKASERIYQASTSELLQDEQLGQLEFVSSDGSVFPVEGEVVTTFSESGRQVEISGEPMAEVRAVLSGTVAVVEEGRVTVQNDNGTRSVYTGVAAGVNAGDYVERSQVIGTLSGEVLALETASGTGFVDSLSAKELEETLE